MRRRLSLLATIALLAALGAHADELTLKDGSKIDGTIVGFEGNSFRVKTSYGFAVVRKDQLVSIRITDLAKGSVATKKPAGDESTVEAAAKPAEASAASAKSATPQPVRPASIWGATTPSGKLASAASALRVPASAVHAPVAVRMSSPSAAAAPVAPATPLPIREQVTGNTYTNDTYGFSMFKPPDWELVEGARTLLPGAITAMGTGDQTTYLLIGQDPAGKSIESQMNATVSRLGGIMDNFRPLAETRVNVSGSPAIERRFHGTVDQREWSGVVVLIPRGARVFTIFGMTFAETDLVQIQENVISRTISSLQFAKR
ncbi:MAG TPA: hypothetical protein VKS44_10570 [Candidatus Acidoferrales bacterium]|nr:hypothetical protein [Candidatus Acidoferrales bacterium]